MTLTRADCQFQNGIEQVARTDVRELEKKFLTACSDKDINTVKKCIEDGVDINVIGDNEDKLLYQMDGFRLASRKGCIEIIELLIKHGVDIKNNSRDKDRWTALMWASFGGNLETIEYLVKIGVDINEQIENGTTALMITSKEGLLKTTKLLIEEGADVNITDNINGTALMTAARNGQIKIVNILIENDADVNAKNKLKETALFFAKRENHTEVVKLLEKAIKRQPLKRIEKQISKLDNYEFSI